MAARYRSAVLLFSLLAVCVLVGVRLRSPKIVEAESEPMPWSRITKFRIVDPAPRNQPAIRRDLPEIRARKTLRVLAPYNSTSYFLYRGEPMGYEYELLRRFAKEQNLALKMVVVRDGDQLAPMLRRGDGDVVAARLVPPGEEEAARQGLAYTRALYRTKPALVQRKPGNPEAKLPKPVRQVEAKKEAEGEGAPALLPPGAGDSPIAARLITRHADLAGERVTLPRSSPYHRTLVELEQEISGDIVVVDVGGNVDAEALIERVSQGEVDLTVAQENLAKLKESVYSNVKVVPALGPRHPVSWAVRGNSPELRAALDRWIEQKRDGAFFRQLYKKYFVDRRRYRERVKSRYLTSRTGRLCPYDPVLKRYASQVAWDWRLLASQAYQESKFDPGARSWAGASGLLQLMPATARQFRVRDRNNPDQNVRGAVEFLKWLKGYWQRRIPDESERLKFILASYNAGPGHVEDARRITAKYGDDPCKWDEVAYWMLQLSQKTYYTDPVVRYGYVRGLEPVTYVGIILERYDHYRQFVES